MAASSSRTRSHPWPVSRSAAHRANPLRVAGDLPAAEEAFADLRRVLGERPAGEARVKAEILILEASLATYQRDTSRAESILKAALHLFEEDGGGNGLARTQVELANLLQAEGRPQEVGPLLEEAAALIDRDAEPYLYRCIVHGRLTALLDLDRPGAAADLLREERESYLTEADDHARATLRFLEARIQLGLEQYEEAETSFTEARDQLLAVERSYDAVLASLYLADALLAAGKTRQAQELAAELIPMFRQRGVSRETLASLRRLAQAARSEALTQAVVAEVRGQV